jgi:hypothetical protein
MADHLGSKCYSRGGIHTFESASVGDYRILDTASY